MQKDRQVIRKLKCISIVSLMFMTVQILGGIMANSVAILADAFHLLSDVLAYVISLQAVLMSYRKPPFFMTFGYQKVQPLGALINVSIIWFVTIQLVIQATERIINKSVVQDPLYMLLTSFFGLGCNLYIMRVLHSDSQHGGHSGCSHSHGEHGHDHKHEHKHAHIHSHNGKKCNHDHNHGRVKKSIKKQKQQQHKTTNKKKHTCTHSHQHQHEHQHKQHKHQQNEHNHNNEQQNQQHHDHQSDENVNQNKQHDHQHQHQNQQHDHSKCSSHSHKHQHQHNKQQHKQQHKHSQSCSHSHNKKSHNNNQQVWSQRQFTCEIQHDHLSDSKACNEGYQKLTHKYSLNQQITPYTYATSYKLDRQVDLSDQSLKISQKQRARRQLFNNINIQAAYIHIISDIILSIGVIISALIIYYGADREVWTYWQLADPFCTYLFSLMAIYSTVGIARDSAIILLDGCDDKQLLKQIQLQLKSIQDIEQCKDFRLWSLNRSKFCAALNIIVKKQIYQDMETRDQIKQKVVRIFTSRDIKHYIEIQQVQQKDSQHQQQKMLKAH